MAEKALHRVSHSDEAAQRAQENYRQTVDRLEKMKSAYSWQSAAVEEAWKAVAADEPIRSEIEALQAESKNLESTLPRYENLSERQKQLSVSKAALERAAEQLKKTESDKIAHASALNQIRAEIASLEGCDAEAERLKNERDVRRERYDSLTSPKNGIIADIKALLRSEDAVEQAKKELMALTHSASESEERYHLLYQRFLGGQAGIIAQEMEAELAQKGMTVCPVCNTAFRSGDAHCFALPSEHIPSKDDVEKAELNARNAEKRRKQAL